MRIYLVGTDTAVGKTTVAVALLRAAALRSLRVIPFKPAQSGGDDDIARLLRAAGLDPAEAEHACPHRFAEEIAPGLADDPAPFVQPRPTPDDGSSPPLRVAQTALQSWERRHGPWLTLIEGAGGLHVPMPGGSWQPRWIDGLAPYTVVIGRESLGTINHTLTTIVGLRHLGRPPLGFILSQTSPVPDASAALNASVIATASGVPHLGTLAHGASDRGASDLLDALLARLPRPPPTS